ncbi:MAG: DUF3160 domain-containing protein [Candidatus Aminicenantes bacterium]|nr:DUF3160 domain-containing protein [Candidatus Aminicenantes bacterium]
MRFFSVILLLCGRFIAIGMAAEIREYTVVEDIAPLYKEIPAQLGPPVKVSDGNPPGFIYGNTFRGKPVEGNSRWIEVIPPILHKYHATGGNSYLPVKEELRYIPARDVEPAPLYKNNNQRFIVLGKDIIVHLKPDINSKPVLNLLKGEVITASGILQEKIESWYRFIFYSQSDEYTYSGISDLGRTGWIRSSDIAAFDPGLDQGKIEITEIPDTSRDLGRNFSNEDRNRFAKQGFFVEKLAASAPQDVDDMADLYRGGAGPVFISSDLFLHAFHLLFDRMLQDVEANKLLPALKELTGDLYRGSMDLYERTKLPAVKAACRRNVWYFGVAGTLLNLQLQIPEEIKADMEKEVQAILSKGASKGSSAEYLPGYREDYSQYKARGHYALNDELRAYFRAMMHFGRKSFMLNDPSSSLSAILITHTLNEKKLTLKLNTITSVIDYLIGPSDDWTPAQYNQVMNTVYAPNTRYFEYAKPAKIVEFKQRALKMLPAQKIVSQKTRDNLEQFPLNQEERLAATAGFKLMGQRYVPDAAYFQKLTAPSVGSDLHPKNLPSGLEIMAILGSKESQGLLPKKWWDTIENYKESFEKTKASSEAEPPDSWKKTGYQSWLFIFKSLFLAPESKQFFMRAGAWGYKSLNTALGSWTELKHDTILYSEQSYAEQGAGSEPVLASAYAPPAVKGYIEPNVEFFSRLSQAISLVMGRLSECGFLTDEYKNKFLRFNELVNRSRDIAAKEINGDTITDEDYAWIGALASCFDRSLLLPDNTGDIVDSDYLKMALIVDVATDSLNNIVLLEGVGYPQQLYALVKDYWGGTRITRGYIYSHYEFTDSKRWNDKEWQEKVYSNAPELEKMEHQWYQKLR